MVVESSEHSKLETWEAENVKVASLLGTTPDGPLVIATVGALNTSASLAARADWIPE